MKTALSTLALVVLTALPGSAGEKPAVPAKGVVKSAPTKCSKCSHAPCRCGFSPSYYTHYRKPLPRVACDRPVTPHWTRPAAVRYPAPSTYTRPAPTAVVVPSPRIARTVPAPTPRVSYGYAPAPRSSYVYRHSGASTSTLVPTPRRARVVPSVTPRVSLGYVPHQSWSHRLATQRCYRRR